MWHEDVWTPILQQAGLEISYIYYPDADNEHDGVVVRLVNESPDSLRYGFTLIFRAPDADTSARVEGRIGPGAMRTGDNAGLFWIPFQGSDRTLGEIGIRGLEVAPANEDLPDESGPT